MPAGPASNPWRRFLRLSVRGLIVVVLVIGAGLGWIVHEAHVQRDAVAAIKRAGGSVTYEGTLWAPRRVVDLIGVDYFGHVTVVELPVSASATDATLADVGRLTRLQILEVYSPSVSDAGLARVNGLTKLRHLRLNGTRVTDAGLVHLKGLSNLSVLGLSRTQVTDAVLVHLKGLTNLKRLALNNTGVTDVGVKEVERALPSLTILR
jgi:hypothetical protein